MFLDLDKKQDAALTDDSGESLTYEELCHFSDQFRQSVGGRSLIFILGENALGAVAGYVAALAHRIVPLVISRGIDAELLRSLVGLYRPAFLWIPIGFPSSQAKIVLRKFNYQLVATDLDGFQLSSDLSLLLSTSGTTGSAKLVRHSYHNVEQNAKNVASALSASPDDRPLAMLPMYYTMGLSVITSHLYAGSNILLTSRTLTDPKFWGRVKTERATHFTGVPYSFEVLDKLRFYRMDLPYLRVLSQGGGKLRDELFARFATHAEETGRSFIATYGQTEGTARMAYLPGHLATTKVGSIGFAIPGGELSLVDSDRNVIPPGVGEGELVYKGPNVTLGYALTGHDLAKGDENKGVLFTGDLARRDADGCYYILGRQNRFLKIYGVRVGLDELDNLIKSHYDIDCVSGGDDDRLLVYVTREDAIREISEFIALKTGLFHKSFEVRYIDQVPRNTSGKAVFPR